MQKTTKTVEVEIPEVADLPIDATARESLDSLCSAYRQIQAQISGFEKTKQTLKADLEPLAESLNLPDRVLGEEWDLRRTPGRETFKVDRLKIQLLHLGWSVDSINNLIDLCTEEGKGGWAVYPRSKRTDRTDKANGGS